MNAHRAVYKCCYVSVRCEIGQNVFTILYPIRRLCTNKLISIMSTTQRLDHVSSAFGYSQFCGYKPGPIKEQVVTVHIAAE